MLADLPASRLDADALRAAIADGEREGIRFDCKLDVDLSDREKRAEFALDVTSFANTAGGVLLIGATETEGRLAGLPGLPTGTDVDHLTQQLGNVLRDTVDPPLPDTPLVPIEHDGATLVAVSISRSWRGPHLVRRGAKWSVARRNSSGKYQLQDAGEIRETFTNASDVAGRLQRWHTDRVADAVAPDSGFSPGSRVILTVRPFTWEPVLDVPAAMVRMGREIHLPPLGAGGGNPAVNLEGIANRDYGRELKGQAQLYRDGAVAYIDRWSIDDDRPHDSVGLENSPRGIIAALALAKSVITGILNAATASVAVGATPPFAVQLTITGVRGHWFAHANHPFDRPIMERDMAMLPATILDTVPDDVGTCARAVRPLLDALWNAAGLHRCNYYNDAGDWEPPR